jgi:hypothetical protein
MSDVGAAGVSKEGSARPEYLLDAILPTLKKSDIDNISDRLEKDASLRAALIGNPATKMFLGKLAAYEPVAHRPGDYLKKVARAIVPNVVQVRKVGGGFQIKVANSEALIPDSENVSRPAAVGALGGDFVSRVESDGTTTVSTQKAVKETLTDLEIKVADSFGLYKVRTKEDNREIVGWVFPKVMDFDGTLLPMAVFTNGSESALQENIAGSPMGRLIDVPNIEPNGFGCFYMAEQTGVQALIPVNIIAPIESPEGLSYGCQTAMGEQVTLVMVPSLKMVTPIDEGRIGIPEDCGFLPLPGLLDLASSPDEFLKSAEARALPNAVRVITDGQTFTFQGAPVEKLAGVMETAFLDKDDAVFLGAVLGADPGEFSRDLGRMRKLGSQEVWFSARKVSTLKEKYASAKRSAVEFLDRLPDLRVDLLKEAAPIVDPTAVDKILSLGFINPENLSTFAGYIPEIELTIRKLAEILLATRLGLHAVDEGAIQRALVHMDKVVSGLKTIGSQA